MKPNSPHITDAELLLFADHELPARRVIAMHEHLAICSQCEERLILAERNLAAALDGWRETTSKIDGATRLRGQIRARLAQEQGRDDIGAFSLHSMFKPQRIALVCTLLLMIAIGFQVLNRRERSEIATDAGPLPNPAFTPGSTRQVVLTDLCISNNEDAVKEVPNSLEQRVFQEYGIKQQRTSEFEVDYLITPGLGGSDDVNNLWPEPHADTVWNSYVKDQLEGRLHEMVCQRKIPLEQAQREIAGNWISAYKKYFKTDQPLASTEQRNPATLVASKL